MKATGVSSAFVPLAIHPFPSAVRRPRQASATLGQSGLVQRLTKNPASQLWAGLRGTVERQGRTDAPQPDFSPARGRILDTQCRRLSAQAIPVNSRPPRRLAWVSTRVLPTGEPATLAWFCK